MHWYNKGKINKLSRAADFLSNKLKTSYYILQLLN